MQRLVTAWGVVLLMATAAFAAERPGAAERGIVLEGEQKLRYIVKQIDLAPNQKQDAEALMAVYAESMKAAGQPDALIATLNQIQIKVVDMNEAKARGDTAAVEAIKEEIRKLTPGAEPEREFFEGLASVLNEKQREKLAQVRKRIENNPDVSLSPLDVIQTAQGLGLDQAQREKLDSLLSEFRTKMATNRPATLGERIGRVDDLAAEVRKVLTADQAKRFDEEIERLRPPLPANLVVTTQPSGGDGPKARVMRGSAIPVSTDDPDRRVQEIVLEPGVEPIAPPPPPGSQPANP
jgi:hypothetical protein